MTLTELNALSPKKAMTAFAQCCVSERWMHQMANARPFESIDSLQEQAVTLWQGLEEADYLEAFEGHPKIGDVSSLKKKFASTKQLAAGEQSSVQAADDLTISALAAGNQAYEEKFGFIFIVCATGKSAKEMLDLLEARLPNDRLTEVQLAADEQAKITRIRINKLLDVSEQVSE